jgi:4-hydroxy-tetrahydrodipicolinate reductase
MASRGRTAAGLKEEENTMTLRVNQWFTRLPAGCYRVQIEGSPALSCYLGIKGYDGDHDTGGVTATPMRVINAMPAVCAAQPGMLSTLDLRLVTARHLMFV